jgi:hypothetical protein
MDAVFFDALNSTGVLPDALYVHRDEKVIKVGQGAEEEVIVDYAGVRRKPGVFMFDDEIWLNCVTIWRKIL